MNRSTFSFFCIIIFSLLLLNISVGGELRENANKVILKNFPDSIKILTYKLKLDKNLKLDSEKFARQRFLGKFIYFYEIKENEQIIGYAILDNVKGKVKPITFLSIFNIDYSVKSVEIIKYREQHGGAIQHRDWLNQFNRKNVDSGLELNSDIDGITGATISVKAVLKGVKRLLYFITNLDEDERNLLVSTE